MTKWTENDPVDPHSEITAFFENIITEISGWVPVLADLFDGPGRPPRAKQLDAIARPLAASLVQGRRSPIVGAGFVAAENALADATWHMAWWQGEGMEPLVLLSVGSASETYMRREWFTKPMATGQPHITGPYVDFLCTDEYTVTMTVPVAAAGRKVGVVGADVFVESLEHHLVPMLGALHPAASLVNQAGRVVVSADAQLAAGTLLVPHMVATGQTIRPRGDWYSGEELFVMPCGQLPMAVVHPAMLGTSITR